MIISSALEAGKDEPRYEEIADQKPDDASFSIDFDNNVERRAVTNPKSGAMKFQCRQCPYIHWFLINIPLRSVFIECCTNWYCRGCHGKLNVTVSGRKCQHWHRDFPHKRNDHVSSAQYMLSYVVLGLQVKQQQQQQQQQHQQQKQQQQ